MQRFSDEQIFTILRANEDEGVNTADVCAASGVTLPMYCLWKARYRHLTLPELRDRRRQERRHALLVRACLVTVVALGLAGVGLFVIPDGRAEPAASPVVIAPAVRPTPPHPAPTGVSPAQKAQAAPIGAADGQLAVQIAAEPDLQKARALVKRLETAGYSAYVLPTTVGALELFRVRVGPFESWRDAQDIVRLLERDGYAGTWIAK